MIVNKAAFDALGARTQAALQKAGAEAPTGLYGPANSVDCAITPPRPAMPTKPFQVPKTILGVIATVDVSEALDADDPRFVQTQEARGSQKTLKRLATKFGLDLATRQLLAPTQKHVLFFGHIGSGKTTQLRQYAKQFSQTGRLFVVEVNVVDHLDPYDLQYTETLVLMAQTLLERLHAQGVAVDGSHLSKLQAWFSGRIQTQEMARDLSLEIKSGGELGVGIPLVARMFSAITTAFKTNASYKDTLRTEVRNSFKDFAAIFNQLLRDSEKVLAGNGLGERVLFVLDGTDKLRDGDSRRFFIEDAQQLLAIQTLALYAAPLDLKYGGNLSARQLDADIVLPMIKPNERDGSPYPPGQQALREILLHRADRALFASDAEIGRLVDACGGHPRELLRLLKLCCEFAEDDLIDAPTVELAIRQLAAEYRAFLEREDYVLLQRLDTDDVHAGNDERTRRLLHNLALLEYNDGSWRRSHPVVRTLEGYRLLATGAAAMPLPTVLAP